MSLIVIPAALYLWLPAMPVNLDGFSREPGPMVVEYVRLYYSTPTERDQIAADVTSVLDGQTACADVELFEIAQSPRDPGTFYVGVWRPSVFDGDLAAILRDSLEHPPARLRAARVVEVPTGT